VTGHTRGFEIDFMNQTDGSKLWHDLYHYPQAGFEFIYLDLANPSVLGDAAGLLYIINFPLSYRSDNFRISFRLGTGLGWVTNKFDRIENHQNLLISSHINAAIQLDFESRIKIAKSLYTNFDIGITHFSNGSFKTPNLGINNASASIGLNYYLPENKISTHTINIPTSYKKYHFEILLAAGSDQRDPPGGNSFFASTLSFTALKQTSPKALNGISLDVFYDLSVKSRILTDSIPFHSNFDAIRSGIYFDHEQLLGRTSIVVGLGTYIIDHYKKDGNIYDRFGFKFRLSENIFANVTLKAHYAKADFVEWGIGVKI
jgi:hypothetical protein